MRKYAVAGFACLALAGCGHSAAVKQAASNPQVKADQIKAQQTVKACLPANIASLRTKGARKAFVNCAVPPKNRLAFEHCITNGILSGIPTKSKIENTALACVGKYA